MREILFRGKKANKDKWIYGVPVKGTADDESEMLIVESVFSCEEYCCRGCNFDPVIPETVGQFTGLTDKNGKKIFEGDIVRLEDYWDEGKVFIVKYTDDKVGSCGCCFPEFGGIGFVMEAKDGERVCYDKDVIVIGNVTDNPELLESE